MSPAYFSTVFKKETGQAYIAYLTDVRLNRAVELLMTTEDKTYIIAEKVGYPEQNYFSYVFKKKFGVSPTKFRGAQINGKKDNNQRRPFFLNNSIRTTIFIYFTVTALAAGLLITFSLYQRLSGQVTAMVQDENQRLIARWPFGGILSAHNYEAFGFPLLRSG